jgi:hypothetical protein
VVAVPIAAVPVETIVEVNVELPPEQTVVADAVGVLITGIAATVYVTVAVVLQSVAASLAETV